MNDLLGRAREWIASDPDPETRAELEALVAAKDMDEVATRMTGMLAFGTAGLRGRVGAGPARMNRAVVIRTSKGLADFLIAKAEGVPPRPVVVGFDARPSSRQFAADTVGVLAAAGIGVRYFAQPTPTPLVAYAAKHLAAEAAVVITASHNPPADNGYKVYDSNAAQIIPPVDFEITGHIELVGPALEVDRVDDAFAAKHALIGEVEDSILDCYWEELAAIRPPPSGSICSIVYTPLHGVGGALFLEVMRRGGHSFVQAVPEQATPDGTFPTLDFPNPEEPGALDLAIELAKRESADVVLANDPDADRLAAVISHQGSWRPLTGNQIGILLADYLLASYVDEKPAIVANSIVSTPMLGTTAAHHRARHVSTLTGFKWICNAGLALENAGEGRFLFGFEEALGYSAGGVVRDKDGLSAGLLFADLAAVERGRRRSVIDRLEDLYQRDGLWVSTQQSLVRDDPDGVAAITAALERLGEDPPHSVAGLEVTAVTDYRTGAEDRPFWLGSTPLLELGFGGRGRALVRPSGTEPKLKIYVDLTGEWGRGAEKALLDHAERVAAETAQILLS